MSSFTDKLGLGATFGFFIMREAGLFAMIVTSNETKKKYYIQIFVFLAAIFYFFFITKQKYKSLEDSKAANVVESMPIY